MPFWTVTVSYYGPAEVVKAQWEYTKKKASAIAGASFTGGDVIAMPPKPEDLTGMLSKSPFGIPALSIFSIGARSEHSDPTQGHITCSPIIRALGEGIVQAYELIQKTAQRLALPVTVLTPPIGCWARTFVILVMMAVSHEPEKNKRTRAGFRELIRILADHGYGEYRTAPAFQDDVMATYGFNNHGAAALPRSGEGRDRSQRHPLRRPLWRVAEASAGEEVVRRAMAMTALALLISLPASAARASPQRAVPGAGWSRVPVLGSGGEQVFHRYCWECHGDGPDRPERWRCR